jgi:NlpC/P60 family putative phage cell wall peptidase
MTAEGLVVQLAREWIGTPYRHRSAIKGVGTDCLGLLRGIWRELYGKELASVPHYGAGWNYRDRDEELWNALRQYCVERPRSAAFNEGEILLFRMRSESSARHLGVLSQLPVEDARFIHAYERHGVVESPFSAPWKRKMVARFEFA